ncbi:acetamidase, partial [Candidatus Omnitrophota bacterium]
LTVTVRISLLKGLLIEEPHYETESFIATTGVADTMLEAAKKATLYMIRHLAMSYNLSLDEAYVLCSAAMDLKICSAAGLPNYLVSAHFSKDIIREG